MTVREVNQKIDDLLHDAEHAESGARFALSFGDTVSGENLRNKYLMLRADAEALFLANTDAKWPDPEDCEWPAPRRNV